MLFRLTPTLAFDATTDDRALLKALQTLLAHEDANGDWLPLGIEVDLSFASEQWQRTIVARVDGRRRIARRHFEVCVFSNLATGLKSGDVAISGSDTYADYHEQLLRWSDCEPIVADYCSQVGMPMNAPEFVANLRTWLAQTAERVDSGFSTNSDVGINPRGEPVSGGGRGHPHRPQPRRSKPRCSIGCPNAASWTCWPTSTSGPTGCATSGRYPDLSRSWLSPAALHPDRLHVRLQSRPLSGRAPSPGVSDCASCPSRIVATSASINWMPRSRIQSTRTTGVIFPRCGEPALRPRPTGPNTIWLRTACWPSTRSATAVYGGIAYHHVADTYVALLSHFIPCGVSEAVYIIEGLLKNTSDLQPTTVHGDTQAQSTPVFGLAHLLGIKLMPRIRNWKELTFLRPTKDTRYQHIDALFTDPVDWELIETHWQDLFQVVHSVKAGLVSSALLLRKLGRYSRRNRLYQAVAIQNVIDLTRAVRALLAEGYPGQARGSRHAQCLPDTPHQAIRRLRVHRDHARAVRRRVGFAADGEIR